jgi:hypothetical protein
MITKENDLIDKDWYEVVCSYIEDIIAGGGNLIIDSVGNHYSLGNLLNLTSGQNNTVIGNWSGAALTEGNDNNIIGNNAGNGITTEDYNTIMGGSAGNALTGEENSIFGNNSTVFGTTIDRISAFGAYSARLLTASDGGVYIGYSAGYQLENDLANPNIFLGNRAGYYITGTSIGNLVLGSNAGPESANDGEFQNQGWIDNRADIRSLFKLEFDDPLVWTPANRVAKVHGNFIGFGDIIGYYGEKNPYVKLCLHLNSDYSDSSINSHAPTNGGAVINTVDPKFGIGCADFADEGDYVQYADSADWFFGVNPMTIEMQIKPDSMPAVPNGGYQTYPLVSQYDDADNYWWLQIINYGASGYFIEFESKNTADDWFRIGAECGDISGSYHHIMVCREGAGVYIFLDGILLANGSPFDLPILVTSSIKDLSSALRIGSMTLAGPHGFVGQIDEFRITKGLAWFVKDFIPPYREFFV